MQEFIKKEKVYLLMLFFVIACNLIIGLSSGPGDTAQPAITQAQEDLTALQDKVKEKFSSPSQTRAFLEENRTLGIAISLFSVLVLSIMLAGTGLLIFYIYKRAKGRELIKPVFKHSSIKWGILDIARVLIVMFFFGYLLVVAEGTLKAFLGISLPVKNIRALFHTTFSDILIVAVVIYFVTRKYRQRLTSIGISLKDAWRNVLTGALAYIAVLPLLAAVLFVVVWIIELIGFKPPVQPVVGLFLEQKNLKLLIYMTIFVSLLGPIAEEVFFRGFVYKAMRGKLGVKVSLLLVGLAFALLHADLVAFLPIFVLGLLLGFLYEKTGSLIPSFTVHILHNSMTVSMIFIIKYFLATIT